MSRWLIIRHARFLWLSLRFWLWWRSIGFMFPCGPNPSDIEYLRKVWRGEA